MSAPGIKADPWRLACPEGHRHVRRMREDTHRSYPQTHWHCTSCGETYETVTDLKTGREVPA